MRTMSGPYDAIAVEIHRRALENIVREMGLTLSRTSGSPIVTYSHDFSTCLLDGAAEQLALIAYVLVHSATSWIGTRTLVEDLRKAGEVPAPGDGWIVNDPYHGGAVHQGDIAIIVPTFYEGSHLGWSFANVHVMDVGGVGVSGFAPAARSVYEEGLRFPMVKAIREGRLDSEWERYIACNVRVPDLVINDLRSMIAANHVAQIKLIELINRFGLERHHQYSEINKDLTENLLRSRIERIPDGVYESHDWTEYDGQGPDLLLDVSCTLEVAGSELRFRFAGAPQIDAYVNSCDGAIYGRLMTSILTTLGYGDLPFNAGMWRPIKIDQGPPGTIVNAVPPVPVSATHSQTGSRVSKLVKHVLSQALSLSDDPVLRGRLGGQPHDGAPSAGLFGKNQHGGRRSSGTWIQSQVKEEEVRQSQTAKTATAARTLQGWGWLISRFTKRWIRSSSYGGGCCRIAEDPGSSAADRGMDQAYAVLYTDRLAGFAHTPCAEAPPIGFGGGYPASASDFVPTYSSNVQTMMSGGTQPLDDRGLQGNVVRTRNNEGYLAFTRGDILRFYSGGGGGVGDPLFRDPKAVAKDVRDGYVTREHAETAYGVVIDDRGEIDIESTLQQRESIRQGQMWWPTDEATQGAGRCRDQR